jgi:hypothetical protein
VSTEVIEKYELAVMDHTGDTKTIWDPRNADEVDAARDTFNKLKKKGYAIFRVKGDGTKGTQMSAFESDAEKMIAVPPIVGG